MTLTFQRVSYEEWLALEDDFRTLGTTLIAGELSQLSGFLAP